jgi:hypothetical protein
VKTAVFLIELIIDVHVLRDWLEAPIAMAAS